MLCFDLGDEEDKEKLVGGVRKLLESFDHNIFLRVVIYQIVRNYI